MGWRDEARHAGLAGAMWAGTLLGAGAGFLTQVALARRLGPNGLAPLSTVLAVTSILVPLALFGAGPFLIRALGARERVDRRLLAPLWALAWGVGAVAATAAAAWMAVTHPSGLTPVLSLLVVPLVLGGVASVLAETTLVVEGRPWAVPVWQVFPNLLRMTAVALGFLVGLGLREAAVALAAAALALALASSGVMARSMAGRTERAGQAVPGDVRRFRPRAFLAGAWPFALSSLLYGLFAQGSVVVVAYLGGPGDAAVVGLALMVYLVAQLLPSAVSQKLLHVRFTRWRVHEPERLATMYRRVSLRMLAVGVAVAVAGALVAPVAVPLVFGPGFRSVVLPLQVMLVGAPLRFVASVSEAVLNAGVGPRTKTGVEGLAVAVQLTLAVALVPSVGPLGAAVALVVAEVVMAAGFWMTLRSRSWAPDVPSSQPLW